MRVTKAKISMRAYTCLFFLLFAVRILCALTNREQVATFAQQVTSYEQRVTALYNKKNKGIILIVPDQVAGAQLKKDLLRLITSIDQYRKTNTVAAADVVAQPEIVALDREAEGLRHKVFRLVMLLHKIIPTTIFPTKKDDQKPKPEIDPQQPNPQQPNPQIPVTQQPDAQKPSSHDQETPEPHQEPEPDDEPESEIEDSDREPDQEPEHEVPDPNADEDTEQLESNQEAESNQPAEDQEDSDREPDEESEPDPGPQPDISGSGPQEPSPQGQEPQKSTPGHDKTAESESKGSQPNQETAIPEPALTPDQGDAPEVQEALDDDPLAAISQLFNESAVKQSEHPEYYFLNQDILDRVKRSGLESNQLDTLAQKCSLGKQNVAWMISLARKAQRKVDNWLTTKNPTDFLIWLISCQQFEGRQGFDGTNKDFAFYPEASRNKEWLAYFLKAVQVFGQKIGGKSLLEKLKDDKDKKNKEHIKQLYEAARSANNGCTEVLRSFGFPEPPITGPSGEILLTAAEQAQKNQQTVGENKEKAQKAQQEFLSIASNLPAPVSEQPPVSGEGTGSAQQGAGAKGQEGTRKKFNDALEELKRLQSSISSQIILEGESEKQLQTLMNSIEVNFSSMRSYARSLWTPDGKAKQDLSEQEYAAGRWCYLAGYSLTSKIHELGAFDDELLLKIKQSLQGLYNNLKDKYETLALPPVIRQKKRTQEEQAKIDKSKKEQEENKKNQGNIAQGIKEMGAQRAAANFEETSKLFHNASFNDLSTNSETYKKKLSYFIDPVRTQTENSYKFENANVPEPLKNTFYDQTFAVFLKLKEFRKVNNALFNKEYAELYQQLLVEPYKKDLEMFDKKILAEANKQELLINRTTREGIQKLLTNAISRLLSGYAAIKKYYETEVSNEAIEREIPQEMIAHGIELYKKIGDFVGKRSMGTISKVIKLEAPVTDQKSKKILIPGEKELVEKLYTFLTEVKTQAESSNLILPDKDIVNEQKEHGVLAADQSTESKQASTLFQKPGGPSRRPRPKEVVLSSVFFPQE